MQEGGRLECTSALPALQGPSHGIARSSPLLGCYAELYLKPPILASVFVSDEIRGMCRDAKGFVDCHQTPPDAEERKLDIIVQGNVNATFACAPTSRGK